MAKLTEEMRAFIVTSYAVFDGPAAIRKNLLEIFGVEVIKTQINKYNPESQDGKKRLGAKWKNLFVDARKNFLEEKVTIPIANRAYRLRELQKMHDDAMENRNYGLAKSLLEQAAKEAGESYTNVQKVKASGTISHVPIGDSIEEKRNILTDKLADALDEAAENASVH